ncbi:MAG: rhodanese-like domain-containing protein [Fibrobacteria bacterium]|nr:rhodanese-like domain-containing protein [Fibrobacteria bacterium]
MLDVRGGADEIIANDSCYPYFISSSRTVIEGEMQKVPKNIPLVVTCYSGATSAMVSGILDELGYMVYNLLGGISSWTYTTRSSSLAKPLSSLPELSMDPHPAFSGFTNIGYDTLTTWMTRGTLFPFILLDIRDVSELTTVIGNDSCRPYNLSWNQGKLASNTGNLPKDTAIILYCRSGNRSAYASAFLKGQGLTKIYNLIGGITLWPSSTIAGNKIRALSELPAPSMDANPNPSAVQKRDINSRNFLISLSRINGTNIIIRQTNISKAAIDKVNIYNINGTLSQSWDDPFSGRDQLSINLSSTGVYLVGVYFNDRQRYFPVIAR